MSERSGEGGNTLQNIDQRVIDCNNGFNAIVDRFNTLLDFTWGDMGLLAEGIPNQPFRTWEILPKGHDDNTVDSYARPWELLEAARINLPLDNPFSTPDNPVDHVRLLRTSLYANRHDVANELPIDTVIRILIQKPHGGHAYTVAAKIKDIRSDGQDRTALLEREKHLDELLVNEEKLNAVQKAFFDDELNPALTGRFDRVIASDNYV